MKRYRYYIRVMVDGNLERWYQRKDGTYHPEAAKASSWRDSPNPELASLLAAWGVHCEEYTHRQH